MDLSSVDLAGIRPAVVIDEGTSGGGGDGGGGGGGGVTGDGSPRRHS